VGAALSADQRRSAKRHWPEVYALTASPVNAAFLMRPAKFFAA